MNNLQKWQKYAEMNPEQSRESFMKIREDILNSPLHYSTYGSDEKDDIYTESLYLPKIFTQKDKQNFKEICKTCISIFDKIVRAYRKDPAIRKIFRFDPALEKMILHEPGYQTPIPMLRVDIFYNEDTGDFKFCEFNTDGTSAMYENDTMAEFFQKENEAFKHFQPEVEYMNLMQPWVESFMEVWKQTKASKDKEVPSVVITDFLEDAYYPELVAFCELFNQNGIPCELEDIRNLDYDGQNLFSSKTGTRYDAVYRRAVTKDVMSNYHDVLPFLIALKDNKVISVGDFQTQIIHSKMINEALQSEAILDLLSEGEREFLKKHLPYTMNLNSKTAAKIVKDKDRWIIKPRDSYAAKGVWAGVDVSTELWKKLLHDFKDTDYIVQEYIPHYLSENIDYTRQDHFIPYHNMTGLYVYNGKFAGVYSRLSDSGIVSTQYNERMIPTFFLKEKMDQEVIDE
ncbi:glutathionylspermidine synthase family protein [Ileibacterium valens]|uniref:Uncharacterized protein n=1 Tax=Ileibacterium valens TaxID=1862668 RepID=A0A1U7NFK0_9FIRM|nr:glutathionylspermidine synthase family protein [Ileibacterium valens]OLU39087.1 hypothetical protein BO222_07350 [Ileibacterium valens]OLU41736.1 hypothetical protein BM735_03765 [Erysipelotrichaceae bacterium NYU-BL-F16]OLU41825.1 hypothetical protein BO224_02950 [Erysipelotrichaceae bacterium NYU-BL-E8]